MSSSSSPAAGRVNRRPIINAHDDTQDEADDALVTRNIDSESHPDDAGISHAIPTSTQKKGSRFNSVRRYRRRQTRHHSPNSPLPTTATTMYFLVALAKFAAFTDAFLSGLIIPLVPSLLQSKTDVLPEQLQVWAAIFVASYGGAFAVVSPLMPFLTREGPLAWAILLAGLACAGVAFALLQFSFNLYLLLLSRALHGLATAAITATCSTMLATAAGIYGTAGTLSWVNWAVIQSFAMTLAPAVSGYFAGGSSRFGIIFYFAYGLIAFTAFLSLVAARITPKSQTVTEQAENTPTEEAPGYGAISSDVRPRTGRRSSRTSRPSSPASVASGRSSNVSIISAEPSSWSPQLLVAGFGYLVIGLLATSLQTVLPVLAKQEFEWPISATGFIFVALSAPAVLVGPLAGALAAAAPKSARFFTATGFLASVPAFLFLGWLSRDPDANRLAFFLTLAALSSALGISADPLIKEVTRIVGPSAVNDPLSAAAQATSLPSIAYAWGGLVGPLFAGAISWVWNWEALTKVLAVVSGLTGLLCLFCLQGWVGSSHPEVERRRRSEVGTVDEESAPLLTNERQGSSSPPRRGKARSPRGKKGSPRASAEGSRNVTPSTGKGKDKEKEQPQRRHFSVDNFSVATTASPGSLDSTKSQQVRFQVALESPAQSSSEQQQPKAINEGSSSRTNHERRYVMREAPHAPSTDPMLASGSRYVIDEERSVVPEGERPKRHVVVFAEGTAPRELLARHPHHVVAINALDGTAQLVSSDSTDNHSVSVTEEEAGDAEFPETTSNRYVVVVIDEDNEN
ncbi:major facilitator superfamily domain-containing protein [Podospora fimiseda]|uniref:Major facilitator superfamily domain-containing protein n=1 Tax=Podospora fimiseda TaxID=252190 RepID=A0AAN7BXH8_9PEZI|nr:major facilitator superfamily domain-containing protein [Podospora fimiseda]